MNIQNNNHKNSTEQKDFWDSLHMDILASNQMLSTKDYLVLIERSFMFSLFFRGCPSLEISLFQKVLDIKDNGFVILLEIPEQSKVNSVNDPFDEISLHNFIKSLLKNRNCTIGPMITRRISILISEDTVVSDQVHQEESVAMCTDLVQAIKEHFHISVTIGIGSIQNINSIYTSFIDSMACLYYNLDGQIAYHLNLKEKECDTQFDYLETEKRLIESVRLRKPEAYDYFGLIMEWIRPFNDEAKRNKIFEILALANHALQLDSQSETKFFNYSEYIKKFMELEGDQLIELAYQSFIQITSYVKPQTSIDYSNHVVKATREYLENHYADDISLEDMAEQVNISPQYFSKLIKKTTGFNFIDWLSMLRVKKAKELLTNSNLNVKEVCFMVGYKDPNYFSRIFKKRIGITPSEYVKTSSYLNNKS